ncbi:hypothetical protein HDV05_004614 [Chytridiales sp. JEL 0842]|nr:hypothetical protein HDV05_004614 [Chytridiales sp. JEL 0842]
MTVEKDRMILDRKDAEELVALSNHDGPSMPHRQLSRLQKRVDDLDLLKSKIKPTSTSTIVATTGAAGGSATTIAAPTETPTSMPESNTDSSNNNAGGGGTGNGGSGGSGSGGQQPPPPPPQRSDPTPTRPPTGTNLSNSTTSTNTRTTTSVNPGPTLPPAPQSTAETGNISNISISNSLPNWLIGVITIASVLGAILLVLGAFFIARRRRRLSSSSSADRKRAKLMKSRSDQFGDSSAMEMGSAAAPSSSLGQRMKDTLGGWMVWKSNSGELNKLSRTHTRPMVVNAGGNAVAGWGGLKVGESQKLSALEGRMLWVPPEAVAATFMGIPPEEVAKMQTEEGEIQMESVDADEVVATKVTQIAFKDDVKAPPAMRRRSGIDRSTSAKEEGEEKPGTLPVDPSIKPMSYAAIAAKSPSQSSPTRVVSPTTGVVVHEPSSSPSLSRPTPTQADNIIEPITPPPVISPVDPISTKMVRELSSDSEKEAWQSSSLDRPTQQNEKQRQSVQTFTSETSVKSVGVESTNSDILNKMPMSTQDTKPSTKKPSSSKKQNPQPTPPTPPLTPTSSTTTSTKKPKPVSTTTLPTYIPTHLTLHPFPITHADELPITNGDLIHVSEIFADGWGKGVNLSKGKRVGMVPMGCLKEVRGVKGRVERAEGGTEKKGSEDGGNSPRGSGEGGLLVPVRSDSLYV